MWHGHGPVPGCRESRYHLVSASRTVCGEALQCTADQQHWTITIVVRDGGRPRDSCLGSLRYRSPGVSLSARLSLGERKRGTHMRIRRIWPAAAATLVTLTLAVPGIVTAPAHASDGPVTPLSNGAHLMPPQRPRTFAAPADRQPHLPRWAGDATAKAYTIYWKPTADTPALDSAFTGLIERFFKDLGGTPFNNINTQYTDGGGAIQNHVSFGGSWV